jgi:hypothetical protein
MSYKIAWYMALVLVAALLSQLNGCFRDDITNYAVSNPVPTLSTTYVYKTDSAPVVKYGGVDGEGNNVYCPFTGKVIVTIYPNNQAKIWVFSPDQINNKCEPIGDMELVRDDFSGIYNPKTESISLTWCVGGTPSDDTITVSTTEAKGNVMCAANDANGKSYRIISAEFTAPISK